jgi:hypothetical protein
MDHIEEHGPERPAHELEPDVARGADTTVVGDVGPRSALTGATVGGVGLGAAAATGAMAGLPGGPLGVVAGALTGITLGAATGGAIGATAESIAPDENRAD